MCAHLHTCSHPEQHTPAFGVLGGLLSRGTDSSDARPGTGPRRVGEGNEQVGRQPSAEPCEEVLAAAVRVESSLSRVNQEAACHKH